MNTKQKQHLLAYLAIETNNANLDPGTVDGIDGRKTQAAMAEFTRLYGCGENGLVGAICGTVAKMDAPAGDINVPTTGTFWEEIKYFSRNEFKCTCGGKYCNGFPVEPDEKLVRTLDAIREHFGKPFTPNSAIRCSKRNAEVGGASQSQHMYGTAADISVPGVSVNEVSAYAETLLPNTGGIGLYSWGVHIDSRDVKARWDYR